MKIIVHWTKNPTSSSPLSRREWKFIKEAYTTKRYTNVDTSCLYVKEKQRKALKKYTYVHICGYKKISLWVSNIGELGQSIFSNHTYSYICFHRDSYKYLAGFSNFFFFFFSFFLFSFFLAKSAIPIGPVFAVVVSIRRKGFWSVFDSNFYNSAT